jgi:hypothetical protein
MEATALGQEFLPSLSSTGIDRGCIFFGFWLVAFSPPGRSIFLPFQPGKILIHPSHSNKKAYAYNKTESMAGLMQPVWQRVSCRRHNSLVVGG